MGIDHFLRQLRDGELDSDSSEDEPEEEEEPQGKISRFCVDFWIIVRPSSGQNDQKLFAQKVMDLKSLHFQSQAIKRYRINDRLQTIFQHGLRLPAKRSDQWH